MDCCSAVGSRGPYTQNACACGPAQFQAPNYCAASAVPQATCSRVRAPACEQALGLRRPTVPGSHWLSISRYEPSRRCWSAGASRLCPPNHDPYRPVLRLPAGVMEGDFDAYYSWTKPPFGTCPSATHTAHALHAHGPSPRARLCDLVATACAAAVNVWCAGQRMEPATRVHLNYQ